MGCRMQQRLRSMWGLEHVQARLFHVGYQASLNLGAQISRNARLAVPQASVSQCRLLCLGPCSANTGVWPTLLLSCALKNELFDGIVELARMICSHVSCVQYSTRRMSNPSQVMNNEQSHKIYPGIRKSVRPYDGVVTGISGCKVWATVPAVGYTSTGAPGVEWTGQESRQRDLGV